MKKCFLLILILLFPAAESFPQRPDLNKGTFFFPHHFSTGQTISSLGLATAKLPEDVVETDDVFRGPLFSYRIKYGLPDNFVTEGSVETNIVTFQFAAGSKWNYNFGRWGFSAGVDIAYWTGRLKQFGFNTKSYGWTMYPNATVGYRFENFAVSIKSEIVLNLSSSSVNGELEQSGNQDTFNGYTFGFYIEQPLWKDNLIVIGIRSTFLKFYYPMWAAFSTFDRTFFIPEATFSFIL